MTLDWTLRITTFILFVVRMAYWLWMGTIAAKAKPKSKQMTFKHYVEYGAEFVFCVVLSLQLLGLQLLPFPPNIYTTMLGFFFMLLSTIVSYLARRELGANWAHAAEYQIKKDHELITGGIYAYIRHPIYTGVILLYPAIELVSGSYLYIPTFLALIMFDYVQAKKEEKILLEKFGDRYRTYMKASKMFIPYLL